MECTPRRGGRLRGDMSSKNDISCYVLAWVVHIPRRSEGILTNKSMKSDKPLQYQCPLYRSSKKTRSSFFEVLSCFIQGQASMTTSARAQTFDVKKKRVKSNWAERGTDNNMREKKKWGSNTLQLSFFFLACIALSRKLATVLTVAWSEVSVEWGQLFRWALHLGKCPQHTPGPCPARPLSCGLVLKRHVAVAWNSQSQNSKKITDTYIFFQYPDSRGRTWWNTWSKMEK